MNISGRHWMRYEYSSAVTLGEHVLRIVPQPDTVQICDQVIAIEPEPVVREFTGDALGNRVLQVAFSATTHALSFSSSFRLKVLTSPPRPPGGGPSLPWPIGMPLGVVGSAHDGRSVSPAVAQFSGDVLTRSGSAPDRFLNELTGTLFRRFESEQRVEGEAWSPETTLARGSGSCRDLAVLFVECARAQGIPSRIVSGYHVLPQGASNQHALHAWAEVQQLDGRWHGFDPTTGAEVGPGHVPLCRATDQASTLPVEGTYSFQGSELTTTLSFGLELTGTRPYFTK